MGYIYIYVYIYEYKSARLHLIVEITPCRAGKVARF